MAEYSSTQSLQDTLAEALPKDVKLQIRHFSTTPTPCPALFSAPPGQKEEVTYCESQFLAASINEAETGGREVIAFALEVLIYTTERLTTLFVSKADSTGHLHLLKKSQGSPSVLRTVISAFLKYLVESRQRVNSRLVLSLFARSQHQYLFPGSIENAGKHVLDDRELVKWWCRVVDPILRNFDVEKPKTASLTPKATATGYLITPGCDKYETRLFFPLTAKLDPPHDVRWHNSHPLYQIATNPGAPPRCLVPHFPDDPKARFLDALDDEIIDIAPKESPTKRGSNGQWRTVRSLDQFWEMMAFRQECAAGRLVGFLWVVFTPPDLEQEVEDQELGLDSAQPQLITPNQSQTQFPAFPDLTSFTTIPPPSLAPLSPVPSSPIPQPYGEPGSSQLPGKHDDEEGEKSNGHLAPPSSTQQDEDDEGPRLTTSEIPESTKYYYWPQSSRAQVLLHDEDYEHINELLLELDFAGVDLAAESTQRLIDEVQKLAKVEKWGAEVVGRKALAHVVVGQQAGVNIIGAGLIRKRKKQDANVNDEKDTKVESKIAVEDTPASSNGVNILGAGLVRKKVKS